jgi:hypothetical protein
MRSGGFIGVWLRWFFRLCVSLMRDIIIDLSIEGHHPPDRAHGDILPGQETPDAELSSIGMGFLEVIHLDHDREPHLPWGLRARLVAQEARKVLSFKAANPAVDRRTRDVQKATDAALRPPLILEFDDLKTALVALRMAVVGGQGQFTLHGWEALLPELFDRLVVNALVRLMQNNAGQFAIAQAAV